MTVAPVFDPLAEGSRPKAEPVEIDVVVVGAGASGICAGVQLKEAGLRDFVILEKGPDFGGTWWHNTYPGCGVDVPSPLYSFSFAQKSDWSNFYAPQPEILAYMKDVAERYGLRAYAQFGVKAESFVFDESLDRWQVQTSDGRRYLARAVIGGFGGLHIPKIPKFSGQEKFQGEAFHSGRWRHDVDLKGKKVVVIGTGASAVQFVPEIAKEAESLTVFMRSPHWIIPRGEYQFKPWQHAAFKHVPGLRRLLRATVYFSYETFVLALLHPKFMRPFQALAKWHLRRSVPDLKLRELLTPDWTMGCKRVVLSNTYYPALQLSNVTVEPSGVAEFTEHGVRSADGVLHEADVVIYGTGFEVADNVTSTPIVGVNGVTLKDAWAQSPEQYLGTATHGFPNFYTVYGLNSSGGNQSVIFAVEAQVHLIKQIVAWLVKGTAHTRADVRESVQSEFNEKGQGVLSKSVWIQGGCNSWYLDGNGRNVVAWPGSSAKLWLKTRRANAEEFELTNAQTRKLAAGVQGEAGAAIV